MDVGGPVGANRASLTVRAACANQDQGTCEDRTKRSAPSPRHASTLVVIRHQCAISVDRNAGCPISVSSCFQPVDGPLLMPEGQPTCWHDFHSVIVPVKLIAEFPTSIAALEMFFHWLALAPLVAYISGRAHARLWPQATVYTLPTVQPLLQDELQLRPLVGQPSADP